MSKQLSLRFRQGDPSGFAGLTTAIFNDVPPARILREILQNSLDASVDADQKTASVRFEISPMDLGDLPDFRGYERAFNEAVKYHKDKKSGRLSDPAQQVVDTIQSAIETCRAGGHYVLSVLDNGVGFDEDRLTAVLGDGWRQARAERRFLRCRPLLCNIGIGSSLCTLRRRVQNGEAHRFRFHDSGGEATKRTPAFRTWVFGQEVLGRQEQQALLFRNWQRGPVYRWRCLESNTEGLAPRECCHYSGVQWLRK